MQLSTLGAPPVVLTAAAATALTIAVLPAATATAQQPASLDEAIEAYVESQNEEYAGDCADTQSPRDLGRWCSRIVSETSDDASVILGRTFSEFSRSVTFHSNGGSWEVTAEAPVPLVPGEQLYTIEPGDTLSGIALRFDVSVEALVQRNGIEDPDLVRSGRTILIPVMFGK